MPYFMADHVSCCEIDGRAVFLDVARDRYFLLSHELDEAFRTLRTGGQPHHRGLVALIAAGVLVERSEKTEEPNRLLQVPTRSALEPVNASVHARPGLNICLEVLIDVCMMRWQLRTHPLQHILEKASGSVGKESRDPLSGALASTEDQLVAASIQFLLARGYVPIERTCLLDSLSLVRFLSRRRLKAALVFGVTLHPFAAHCWVQVGDLVLNETLSDANAYTPIRVVR